MHPRRDLRRTSRATPPRLADRKARPSSHPLAPTALPPQGTKQDTASALGWFAAAGELGHCSARSRIVAEGFGGLPACIYERLEEV